MLSVLLGNFWWKLNGMQAKPWSRMMLFDYWIFAFHKAIRLSQPLAVLFSFEKGLMVSTIRKLRVTCTHCACVHHILTHFRVKLELGFVRYQQFQALRLA